MRPTTVDYYYSPQSPYAYLGHQRFAEIAKAAGVTVKVMPADFGKVFAETRNVQSMVQEAARAWRAGPD